MNTEYYNPEHLSSEVDKLSPVADTTQPDFVREQLFSLQARVQFQVRDSPSYLCEWMPTSLRLPLNGTQEGHNTYLCLPVHLSEASFFQQQEEKEEFKDDSYCSTSAGQLRLMQLDQYLAAVKPLALSAQSLLCKNDEQQVYPKSLHHTKQHRSKYERQSQLQKQKVCPPHHRLITATNSGRVINVIQGEIAHCTPSQADTLVSDDATTCHIVALWSQYVQEGGDSASPGKSVVATMTHIDGPGYERCIRDAVNEHVEYHSRHSKTSLRNDDAEEYKESCVSQTSGTIEMSIHIMGGFNDHEGSSIEITDSALQTLSDVYDECNSKHISRGGLPRVHMTLETCAVASANDDGTGCPLGRGMAIDVSTGKVFLAEVDDANTHNASLSEPPSPVVDFCNAFVDGDNQLLNTCGHNVSSSLGPEVTLRSVRLWASAFHPHHQKQGNELIVIHRSDSDYLCVDPFFFGPHISAKGLLNCSDEELLEVTSTSPEVEKHNFASNVRQSLTYLNAKKSSDIFVGDQPLKFRRVGLNGWALVSCV